MKLLSSLHLLPVMQHALQMRQQLLMQVLNKAFVWNMSLKTAQAGDARVLAGAQLCQKTRAQMKIQLQMLLPT